MQNKRIPIALFASLFLFSNLLVGQVSFSPDFTFSNETGQLLNNPNFKSRLVVAVADINNDQLDDIIRLSGGNFLEIQLQDNGRPFKPFYRFAPSDEEQFNICLADVDRNGWNDVLLGDVTDGMKLLQFDQAGQAPVWSDLEDAIFYVQGANFADINADGWIDAFVCNDLGPSRIWMNDGAGNLRPDPSVINLNLYSPEEMNAGNYSSIWTDFDNDNDLDLYISKCFATAVTMTDTRRVNQLFVNNGPDGFEEKAAEYGLADGLQSWTSDFQDIDNDGDLDCIVVNHYSLCKLYENDGTGHYSDITSSSDLNATGNYLQVAMRDFDNDGFVDILLAGVAGYEFYYNQGNGKFNKVQDLFKDFVMGTFAVGDLNHDGFPDVYSGSADSINSDVLWINQGEDENHYLTVSLEGVQSNTNAIGARLELYGPWGVQIREVRSGESYGIMHSLTQTFGLGQELEVDKLIIRWPSGLVDSYENLDIDQHVHAVEGQCLYPNKNIKADGPLVFCRDEQVVLKAPKGNQYQWSNGKNSQEITVESSGLYAVTITNVHGCTTISNHIEVLVDPDETPSIEVEGDTVFCRGTTAAMLTAVGADNFQWSTGQTGEFILVLNSGEYTVTTMGLCREFTSAPVRIHALNSPPKPIGIGDTIATSGMVTLTTSALNPYWYNEGGALVGTGSPLELFVSETTSFWLEDVEELANVRCASLQTEVIAFVDPLLDIRPIEESGIRIHPNPFADYFFVDLSTSNEQIQYMEMTDLQGRVIKKYANPSGLFEVQLQDLPAGLYLFRLFSETSIYATKLLKN